GQGRRAWPKSPDLTTRLRLWVGDRLTMFICRRADRFVTGPESMVDYYVKEYGVRRSKCVVLYNDVDLSLYQPVPAAEREVLRDSLGFQRATRCALFVGRVSRYKGGEFILPLARALRASPEAQDVYIVVVGPINLTHLQPELEREPAVL